MPSARRCAVPSGRGSRTGRSRGHLLRPWLALGWLALGLTTCRASSPAPPPEPTASLAQHAAETPALSSWLPSSPSPSPTPAPEPSPTAPAASPQGSSPAATSDSFAACPLLWLKRPIPAGYNQGVDPSYRFASTEEGTREPHHGVEFYDHKGTPVVAAAPGRVVVAGNDHLQALGPTRDFYGELVVIELERERNDSPVFLLYAHLSKVLVEEGQSLSSGDQIGEVGSTGIAQGAHLHFEVRVGADAYAAVRNPELWLEPQDAFAGPAGALAGRITDSSGRAARGQTVTVRPLQVEGNSSKTYYVSTYALESGLSGSDDLLGEDFAISDLDPGKYEVVAFSPSLERRTVMVEPGKLTWVPFGSQGTVPAICGP